MLYHPGFGHAINVGVREVSSDPDTQVSEVVGMMADYTATDAATPELQSDARRYTITGDPVTDSFATIKRRMRFQTDDITARPFSSWMRGPIVETLVRPIDMRAMADPHGDCDDFSMSVAALLLAKGVDCRFVTVAVDPEQPWRYSHVYVVAYVNGERIPVDTSHGPYPGWEVPNLFGKRQEWPIVNDGRWLIGAGVLLAGGLAYWGLRQ